MVSVIMPVYNGEKYLKQSIESVIQQTYKDWELIIVNDYQIIFAFSKSLYLTSI